MAAGGAQVAGVLIERVAGSPLGDVLRERVFEPLGMVDTGFYVPAQKRHRFTTQYAPDVDTGELYVLDRPDGWWAAPPKMPDANGWLVSTIDDLWAFTSMLAADGDGLLSPESVRLMMIDRITTKDRTENSVRWRPQRLGSDDGRAGRRRFEGCARRLRLGRRHRYELANRTYPSVGLTGILLTQRAVTSPEPPVIVTDFWTTAYGLIDS